MVIEQDQCWEVPDEASGPGGLEVEVPLLVDIAVLLLIGQVLDQSHACESTNANEEEGDRVCIPRFDVVDLDNAVDDPKYAVEHKPNPVKLNIVLRWECQEYNKAVLE